MSTAELVLVMPVAVIDALSATVVLNPVVAGRAEFGAHELDLVDTCCRPDVVEGKRLERDHVGGDRHTVGVGGPGAGGRRPAHDFLVVGVDDNVARDGVVAGG